MYFGTKSYLKNTRNHTAKHARSQKKNQRTFTVIIHGGLSLHAQKFQ
jgi:hypothetical protein